MEYSIQEVAHATGTTSRTLRHYDSINLLKPSRIGHNGYRYYNNQALLRLQRILLLRQLGLGLESIRELVHAQESDPEVETQVLNEHLELLRDKQSRLTAQIASVQRTIAALSEAGTETESMNLMEQNIFDGFDHTEYKEEVEQRWGTKAYAESDQWWRSLSKEVKQEWKESLNQLNADWQAAAKNHEDPMGPVAQELATRHVEWLRSIPGTPAHHQDGELVGYLLGLGDMYVADERFAAHYGGVAGATLVRDALRHYVESNLR